MILFAEDASLGSPIQLVFAVDPTINIFRVRWFLFRFAWLNIRGVLLVLNTFHSRTSVSKHGVLIHF